MGSQATSRDNWTRVRFGDVVRLVRDRVDPMNSGIARYVAGEHMRTNDLRIRSWGVVGQDALGPAFHMRFRPGHVLYGSRRTYLRKVAVADFEGICANTTFVLESADPSVLLPEMLPFIMQAEAFHGHSVKQSKGSVNPYVNFSDLAWYEFELPPIEDQRAIASVASLSAGVESELHVLSRATTTLKEAVTRDLLPQWEPDRRTQLVALEELVRPDKRPVAVQARAEYGEIGVRSFGKGVFHKPPTTGEKIGNKRVFEVQKDRLILNIIFAWEGAVAVTKRDDAGRIASHRFPQYAARSEAVNLEYLAAVLLSPQGLIRLKDLSPGGAGRNRTLSQAGFLKLAVPIVSPARQKQLVDVLRSLSQAEGATELRLTRAHEITTKLVSES